MTQGNCVEIFSQKTRYGTPLKFENDTRPTIDSELVNPTARIRNVVVLPSNPDQALLKNIVN